MSSAVDAVNNVKNTFSSWDSCMSKAYCKWPVIAGIIIGSLILLSVLVCIGRCICCGAECACCCFRCCAGCCGSRRRDRGHKQLDPVAPTPYGSRGASGLPMYNSQYRSAPPPIYQNNTVPQTATFEGKVHEDSLPAMPSWENATERRVEVIEDVKQPIESHEMEKLSPTGQKSPTPVPGYAAPSQPASAMAIGNGPHSPYAADERDPFLQGGQSTGVTHDGYRGASPGPGQAVGYGYASHRPGGLQNSQPSFNSYHDSRSDFYAQTGQGGPYDHQPRPSNYGASYSNLGQQEYDRQYGEQRQANGRPYGEQQPGYGRQNRELRQDVGYQQPAGSPVYDPRQPGYDSNQGAYRAFSPAYGDRQDRRAPNGSWKDV
ncbi:uncharacterized protein PV09_00207 [Verruconis gallopava]|uniref:Fibroin-3 related protein n=1 Tax=Verruconis gallopava TaxID=253628 RepID=A0A0D2ARX5_9PEZI|nr:uncharacterized protein PV09_00207 [Verruconis gallopava]KIW09290.1 hypothetical protein PV09_00207 [Verruconis gallopava]